MIALDRDERLAIGVLAAGLRHRREQVELGPSMRCCCPQRFRLEHHRAVVRCVEHVHTPGRGAKHCAPHEHRVPR